MKHAHGCCTGCSNSLWMTYSNPLVEALVKKTSIILAVLLAALILAPAYLGAQAPTLQRALPEADAPDSAAAPTPIGYWMLRTEGYDPQTMTAKVFTLLVRFDVGGTFAAVVKTQTEDEEGVGSTALLEGRWKYGEAFGHRVVCVERAELVSCPYTVLEDGRLTHGTQRFIHVPKAFIAALAPELAPG